MNTMIRIQEINIVVCLLAFVLAGASFSYAQVPKWVSKSHSSKSGDYYYVTVSGESLKEVLSKAVQEASLLSGSGGLSESEISDITEYNDDLVTSNQTLSGTFKFDDKDVTYEAIDTYYSGGEYYVLMAFSKIPSESIPKNAAKIANSGALVLSALLPGSGQLYKKQAGRGFLFLTGFLASAGTTFYFESRRSRNTDLKLQANITSDKLFYEDQARTFEQNRNIGLGVTAVIYVLNLIDAISSRGYLFAFETKKREIQFVNNIHSQNGATLLSFNIKF